MPALASSPFATIRQFQVRFAASARKKSVGSASPVFAVYKARSEQPLFVVWGPWMVPGLECKKITWTIGLVLVSKVAIQNAEHFGGFLVQVRRDECTGFHPDMYDRRTKCVVSVQGFYLDVSGVAWKRQVH